MGAGSRLQARDRKDSGRPEYVRAAGLGRGPEGHVRDHDRRRLVGRLYGGPGPQALWQVAGDAAALLAERQLQAAYQLFRWDRALHSHLFQQQSIGLGLRTLLPADDRRRGAAVRDDSALAAV